MKTIGFIDHFLDEWHANNYPEMIRSIAADLGLDYEVRYAWAEEASPFTGMTSEQWAKDHGITLCASIEELCEKSDVILLLAPDTPEKHLEYARTALSYGKRTFIDKTFADSYASAKEIFRIAKENGTPFYSTSALRYAEELADVRNAPMLMVTGCGVESVNYYVHFLEMIVSVMKSRAESVVTEVMGRQMFCRIFYPDGHIASIAYAPVSADMPFTLSADYGSDLGIYREVKSDFFRHQLENVLKFYETGVISFDTAETLEVMRIRDALLKAEQCPGERVFLEP